LEQRTLAAEQKRKTGRLPAKHAKRREKEVQGFLLLAYLACFAGRSILVAGTIRFLKGNEYEHR
jgi:hypothetical protein